MSRDGAPVCIRDDRRRGEAARSTLVFTLAVLALLLLGSLACLNGLGLAAAIGPGMVWSGSLVNFRGLHSLRTNTLAAGRWKLVCGWPAAASR